MPTTWATLESELISLLGSAIVHDSDTRSDWINMALRHFANTHTALKQTATFNGDGTTRDFVLPADYISIYSVYVEQEEMFYEPISDIPGAAWDIEPDPGSSVRPYSYQEWPEGTLHLTFAPPTFVDGNALVVRYFGSYPEFGDSDGPSQPVWANDAVLSLAVASSYVASLSDMSFLNEFRTRVDSGNPMHNPIIQAYDKMIERYNWLLSSHPIQNREPTYRPGGRGR
jgi:hypothetical protein